jgi:hypothetical protein
MSDFVFPFALANAGSMGLGAGVDLEGGGGARDGRNEGVLVLCPCDVDAKVWRKDIEACFLDRTGYIKLQKQFVQYDQVHTWSSNRERRFVNLRDAALFEFCCRTNLTRRNGFLRA